VPFTRLSSVILLLLLKKVLDVTVLPHVLQPLIPDQKTAYNLGNRKQRLLTVNEGHLCTNNFIIRMLYKDCY